MALRKVIADSSSIILLQKADLFELFCDRFKVVITLQVYKELMDGAKKGAAQLQKYLYGRIDQTLTSKTVFGMGPGESSVIALYLEGGGDFVLLDDKKGANYCKDHSIPFINSLLVSRVLYIAGAIDEAEFISTTRLLTEEGYYSQRIIDKAESISKSELRYFLP